MKVLMITDLIIQTVVGFILCSLVKFSWNTKVPVPKVIIEGEDITVHCKIPDFDEMKDSAKWRKSGRNEDLTNCWSNKETPATCLPSVKDRYIFSSESRGINLTINNFKMEDTGTWTCVTPGNKKKDFVIDINRVLVPPSKCELRSDDGHYTCSTSCIGPIDHANISLYFRSDKVSVVPEVHMSEQSNCSEKSGYTVIANSLNQSNMGNGTLVCYCGLKGFPEYTIKSNSLLFISTENTARMEKMSTINGSTKTRTDISFAALLAFGLLCLGKVFERRYL